MNEQAWRVTRAAAAALILAVLTTATPAAYSERNLRFNRLSLEQGLSQGSIYALIQDSRGFMWFGTEDGVNRYDGYEITIYKHDADDPGSLSHSFVWALQEDRQGNVWIGTNGGGVDRWNRATDTFTHFRNDPQNPNSLSNDRVRVILEDPYGQLWIGTDGGGLNRFDPASNTWTRYSHNPANPASLSNDRIRALHLDDDGVLWVGTYGGGLDRFDPASGNFEHHVHDPADPTSLSDDLIYTIYRDRGGSLWVGTYTNGLNRLDPETRRFTRFQHDPENMRSLGAGRVRSVYQDRDGTLWVGTDAGLNEWKGDGFIRYQSNPADPKSLSDSKITAIYQDRGGVLWVGTKGDGLNKWNPATGFFSRGRRDPGAPSSLSSDRITSFQFDSARNELWVGTFGGGLNRLDRDTDVYAHFRHRPDDPDSLGDDTVMSLLLDRDGKLWIGTYEGGLNRLDPATGKVKRYEHDPNDPSSMSRSGVMALFEDRAGTLWIGTFEAGLYRFDRATEKFVRYQSEPAVPTSLASNTVTSFCEDSSGALWVGTDGGGLSRFDREAGTFTHFRYDPGDPASLSSNVVWSIHEDRDGALWIGTQGGGLNRWNREDREANRVVFTRYTERDGLPNNLVYGVLSDDSGHLWLSTNKGISRFDPRIGEFKNYDTTHGLQSNEFNFGAYYRSPAGEMFFGGIRGFNSFFPSDVRENVVAPPVVLTAFRKNNRAVNLERPIYDTDSIVLDYTDYVVSFEFAALDYAAPEKNAYAYKLEGFDEDWIELGTSRRATYTNLDAGAYTLRVKGSNNDGVWNESSVLQVKVLPPPWKTWWAYTLYAAVLVGVVVAYTRSQARKLEREAEYSRKLENEVQARTRELAMRNDELRDANRKLESASLTDSLTGLRNRRYLMTEIDRSIALTERYYNQDESAQNRSAAEADFLFLMIDLDGLKGINDTYGHMSGDRALLQMRDLLRKTCRKSDTIIRWGGDEFLIVGRNMGLAACEKLAERIRHAVAEHTFDLGDGNEVRLSCSIGFAQYPFIPSAPTHVSWEQVVTIADRALYLAKMSGRNAWVAMFGTEHTPPYELVRLVNEQTQQLVTSGAIEIRTSLDGQRQLVWNRA